MKTSLTIAQYIEQAIAALQPFQRLRIPGWMKPRKAQKPRIPNPAVQQAAQEKRDRRSTIRYNEQLARTMGQFNARARVAERQDRSAHLAATRATSLLQARDYWNNTDDIGIRHMCATPGGRRAYTRHQTQTGPKKGRHPNTLRVGGLPLVDYGF